MTVRETMIGNSGIVELTGRREMGTKRDMFLPMSVKIQKSKGLTQ